MSGGYLVWYDTRTGKEIKRQHFAVGTWTRVELSMHQRVDFVSEPPAPGGLPADGRATGATGP